MKTIRNSKIIKVLRNFFGYKPSLTIIDSNLNNLSTSDAFFGEQIIILKLYLGIQIFLIFFLRIKTLKLKYCFTTKIIIF